jgi:hypothetical protein
VLNVPERLWTKDDRGNARTLARDLAGQAQQRAKPDRGGMRLLIALLDICVCVCVHPYLHPCLDPCLWVYMHAALSRRALHCRTRRTPR